MDSHLPAVAGEVVAHEVAFALIEQIGRVEIETLALPPLSEALPAFVGGGLIGDVFGGQLAAWCAERGDVVE